MKNPKPATLRGNDFKTKTILQRRHRWQKCSNFNLFGPGFMMTNSICCVFKLLRKRDLRSTCCYYYEVLLAPFSPNHHFFPFFSADPIFTTWADDQIVGDPMPDLTHYSLYYHRWKIYPGMKRKMKWKAQRNKFPRTKKVLTSSA